VLQLPVDDTDRDEWVAFVAAGEGHDQEPATDCGDDDPHMILYTSGTTGRPKGAMLSHRRTVDDAIGMAAALQPRPDDTFMNYFPPFHVGNWDHMKLFLLVGARVVLLRQFDAGQVLGLLGKEQVTVVLGVPTMLHELLSHPDLATADTSSVRLIYYGAYDPSGIMQRVAEHFGARDGKVEMAHTFGLTEGGPFVTLCQPRDIFAHWGSVGLPVPGVEVALLDDDGNRVPPGTPGELCMKGPRMSGYWANPEATETALAGGWLHTGDIAITDADGFYFIVDRKKDMIRSGGQNVYSKEVEDCLLTHPDVAEAAVIGLPDPVYEELVGAVVVLRAGAVGDDAKIEELTSYVRSRLAGYNTPRAVIFADELPRNAVGKIQKHLLRAEYGSMFDHGAKAAR
jgi:acyl-CoA synthetase (AMP-forming)/AMP-acid ligase II